MKDSYGIEIKVGDIVRFKVNKFGELVFPHILRLYDTDLKLTNNFRPLYGIGECYIVFPAWTPYRRSAENIESEKYLMNRQKI